MLDIVLVLKNQLFFKRRPLSRLAGGVQTSKPQNRRATASLALLRFQSELLTILCMFLFNILYPWTRIRPGRGRGCAEPRGARDINISVIYGQGGRGIGQHYSISYLRLGLQWAFTAARAQIASNPSRRTNFCYLLFKPHCNPEISLC